MCPFLKPCRFTFSKLEDDRLEHWTRTLEHMLMCLFLESWRTVRKNDGVLFFLAIGVLEPRGLDTNQSCGPWVEYQKACRSAPQSSIIMRSQNNFAHILPLALGPERCCGAP